jgi:hypothetical protein
MSLQDKALEYGAIGWAVFPVRHKQPIVPWRDYSSSDATEISAMQWESATGIGLDCGKSGIVVLDIDDLDALPELERKLGWSAIDDDTCVSVTGGGGYHVFYRAGDQAVRNSASKVVKGVDVRGDGGYVVLPPSSHESGRVYQWHRYSAEGVRPIPEKLVQVLNYREEREPVQRVEVSRSHEKWGLAVLAEEAAIIEASAPGTRNATLFEHAVYVYEVVKGGHLDRDLADLRLNQAAARVGLGSGETQLTLESAWSRAEPRDPKPTEPRVSPQPLPPDSPRKTFRALSIEELEHLPPPKWLLPHRLPEGQTWVYGPPGSGKTFLALDWAATVASTGLNVLYFVGEGVQGFARRVLAWQNSRGGNISTFRAIPQAPHLLERESVETLAATVEQYSPALIVVDTFARAAVGGDENSARDVGLAIDALDMIHREYGASSLVIHHSNKAGAGERGSSAIRGAADATWEVIAAGPGEYSGFQVECRKMKDAEPPKPMLFQLRGHGDSAVLYPPTAISHQQTSL